MTKTTNATAAIKAAISPPDISLLPLKFYLFIILEITPTYIFTTHKAKNDNLFYKILMPFSLRK